MTGPHYLEVLAFKPGALPGATALAQAKKVGAFTPAHQAYWDAARRDRGDAAGTRALIEVLLAHRTHPTAALIAAMERATASGCIDPAALIIDARRQNAAPVAPVIPIGTREQLHDRQIDLTRYDRPAPDLTSYDDLLTGSGT